MTSPRRSWHAYATQTELDNPGRGLVERLLDLLLHDARSAGSARLTVEAGPSTQTYAQTGDLPWPSETQDADQQGRLLSASTATSDGGRITLQVHGDWTDDQPTRAQLRRFIQPMAACVTLESRLDENTDRARTAVAEIERQAITDLATGIVMARRDCDPATARNLLSAWRQRTGRNPTTLSAVRLLELLTADPP